MNIFRNKENNESAVYIQKYVESDNFKTGKKYFILGNFGVFELMDKLGELTSFDTNNLKGIPFAYNNTFDGDQLYVLFIGMTDENKECGIFVNHADSLPYSLNKNACLKQPLKVANSINELFNNQDLNNLFQKRKLFYNLSEIAYHSSEITNNAIKGYLPEIDLRVLFKKELGKSLIIYHGEYNSRELNDFFKDAAIIVEEEFTSFPHQEDYDNLVCKANEILEKQEYFYIYFDDSEYHGIGRFKDLTQNQIIDFLCLGLFYRMTEIDIKYYELNNKAHNTVYTKWAALLEQQRF